MPADEERPDDHAAEVLKRNIERSRELLAKKKRQSQGRGGGESPLEDDTHHPQQSVPSHESPSTRGGTIGQRKVGGGR